MNDFTKEYLETRYDKNSVKYILAHKNMRSFKEYCNCGAFAKDFIKHQSYCNQEQEVIRWINENE